MLRLVDLIRSAGVELSGFKVHCAKHDTDPPLAAWLAGTFQRWQEKQTQKNFSCRQVVSLIHLHDDRWLFAGVWEVLGVTPRHDEIPPWFEYSTREVAGLDDLTGRVIVRFKRTFRASYLRGDRYGNALEVAELRPHRYAVAEFPGFSSVRLPFATLRHIVRHNHESWRSALRSVSGVYLVTDCSDGTHYVGSAYGAEGIWGRWRCYTDQPHGHNRGLIELLDQRGAGHAEHFQFAILEICDPLLAKEDVIARENHWKLALRSRELGHNAN